MVEIKNPQSISVAYKHHKRMLQIWFFYLKATSPGRISLQPLGGWDLTKVQDLKRKGVFHFL
jgi:hypothetical protein